MENILKTLDEAFRLISTVSVRGDDVDAMASARSKLRLVFAELKKTEEEKGARTP